MQYLLAGLGNPGPEYERTRHNAGFRIVDVAARKWGADWKPWQKLGEYAKVSVAGNEVFLLKPHTYMNLSGQAVSSLARFYKITPDRVIVCFDDVSLDVGKLRLRGNGSAGGQKGMKHIIEQLGTDKIARLRLGIGPKPEKFDLVNEDAKDIYKDIDLIGTNNNLFNVLSLIVDTAKDNNLEFEPVIYISQCYI